MFKLLIVIYILKFKTHLIYFMNKELAPTWVRLALFILTFSNCMLCFIAALVDCNTDYSDEKVRHINLGAQTAYLGSLSLTSVYICYKILQKLKTDSNQTIKDVRIRLMFLEGMVQLILLGRLFVTITQKILRPKG